ncbi:hypothetical protein JTE90_017555 [Oedothorax gibbosus]|uniref:Uncharacterized protein n=1 Tax=Oedothorax gibbosus TaxID=931172 RepID=A0AAV6UN09_9ARAC|nr:hypothetical protein JTE90_017555 [Oedothorax gibbosus]
MSPNSLADPRKIDQLCRNPLGDFKRRDRDPEKDFMSPWKRITQIRWCERNRLGIYGRSPVGTEFGGSLRDR